MKCPECGAEIDTIEMNELCYVTAVMRLSEIVPTELIELKTTTVNANGDVEFSCPVCHMVLFEDEREAVFFLNGNLKDTAEGWNVYVKNEMQRDGSDIHAMELAIEKWTMLYEGKDISMGTSSCALCFKYRDINCESGEEKCPIARFTGRTHCSDTPIDGLDAAETKQDEKDVCQEMVLFLKRVQKYVKGLDVANRELK